MANNRLTMYSNNHNHVVLPSFAELEASMEYHIPVYSSVVAQLFHIPEWDPYAYRTLGFPTSYDRSTAYPVASMTSTMAGPSNNSNATSQTQTRMRYIHSDQKVDHEIGTDRWDDVALDGPWTTEGRVQYGEYGHEKEDESWFEVSYEVLVQPLHMIDSQSKQERTPQATYMVSMPENDSSKIQDEVRDEALQTMEQNEVEEINMTELTKYQVPRTFSRYEERKRRYGHGW